MIFHSVEYKKQIEEKGVKAGTILTVPAAEFLSGLPRGWTSPRAGDCKCADVERLFPVEEALPGPSIFCDHRCFLFLGFNLVTLAAGWRSIALRLPLFWRGRIGVGPAKAGIEI